jgi:hypothetical protein
MRLQHIDAAQVGEVVQAVGGSGHAMGGEVARQRVHYRRACPQRADSKTSKWNR